MVENNSDSNPRDSPFTSPEKPADDIDHTPLEERILDIASRLMERRYVLDLDDLYKECIRFIKDVEKRQVQSALSGLVRRKVLINGKALTRQDLLENSNRKRIFEMVKHEPGVHFSRIKANINKESRTVQWHLKMLEKFDLIREERFGNNVVYFDFLLEKQHDRLYYYLHKEGAPAILKAIMSQPGIALVDLIEQLQMPRSTLARKLNVLVSEGFVSASYQANQVMCLSIVYGIAPALQALFGTVSY